MEDARDLIRIRLAGYRLLLSEYNTPLFHNELLDAIKLHSEALNHPDPTPAQRERLRDQLGVLDNMNERLQKRWRGLHRRMSSHQSLLAGISNFQRYLGAWLMLDYSGKHKHAGKRYDWASDIVEAIDDVGGDSSGSDGDGDGSGGGEEDFRVYHRMFVRPVREMMLDQDHVETRLRAAATGSAHPAGEIYRLIDECEWQSLAAYLVNDRRLAVTLFGARQVNKDFWSAQFGKNVLRLIDGVRDKYFTELETWEKYTLSRRARDLSFKKVAARAAAARIPSSTPPPQASARQAAGDSAAVAARKSVFGKVIRGLGLGRMGLGLRSVIYRGISTNSAMADLDSKSQLIEEKEKAG